MTNEELFEWKQDYFLTYKFLELKKFVTFEFWCLKFDIKYDKLSTI